MKKSWLKLKHRDLVTFFIVAAFVFLPLDIASLIIREARADTTGEVFPTLGESVQESPWSDNTWSTPTNIYSDDGSTADVTAATFDAGDQTWVLKATGFDFSSIPDGSTINGITVRTNSWYAVAPGSIDLCQLLDTSKSKVGTNNCSTPQALTTTTSAVYTKGGTSDLWGNSLNTAWVKNANFGVAIGMLAGGSGNNNVDVFTDYVSIEIDYTPPATVSISGTCKQINNSTDCSDTGNNSIRVAVNGVLQAQTDTTVDGSWSISGVTQPTAGQVITVFIEGEASSASQAVAATEWSSGDVTGVELIESHLTVGSNQNTTISNTELGNYDSSVSGKRTFHDNSGTTLTVDADSVLADEKLYISSGDGFTPGGTVNTHDLEIRGTFTPEGNSVNVSGTWDDNGTFTAGSSTVTMTGTAEVLDASTFNNLTIDPPSTGTITASGSLAVSGILNVASGDALSIPAAVTHSGATLTLSGTISGAGTLTMTNTSGSISGGGSISNLTIDPSSAGTVTLTSGMAVTGILTVAAGDRFKINSGQTLTLSGIGTPLSVSGTFEPDDGSTVQYTGSTANVTATTFGHLTLGDGADAITLPAADLTIKGNLSIVSGATIASGSGTLLFGSGGTQSITDNNAIKQNLGEIAVRASTGGNTLLTLGSSVKIASATIDPSQTLDLNGSKTLTIQGSGSPFVANGTFIPSTGTVQYTGGGSVNVAIPSSVYASLSFEGAGTYNLPASDLTLRGNLNIANGARVASSSNNDIIFAIGGGNSQTVTDSNVGVKQNLGEIQISANSGNTTLNLGSSIRIASASIDASQTLGLNGSNTLTITGAGNVLSASGSFGALAPSTGAVVFTGNGPTTIPALDYFDLRVQPSANSVTHTFASGTASISKTFVVGNGTNTGVIITADTNGAGLDVASVSISANSTLVADNANEFTVSRHFINNGSFTHSSGTVTFEGPNTSSISGATAFNNFTANTSGKKLKFGAGQIFTFAGNFTVTGQSGNTIKLESTASASQWLAHFNSPQSGVTYATITDSGCDAGTADVTLDNSSSNGGNNGVCWSFPAAPSTTFTQKDYEWFYNADNVTPAGSVEGTENTHALIADSSVDVRLRMNIAVGTANLEISTQQFKLQYASSSIGPWTDVGSSKWGFRNNGSVADGADIPDSGTLVSTSTNAARQTYQESNPSVANPRAVSIGQNMEYDWSLDPGAGISAGRIYYFRMVKSNGEELDVYQNYPSIRVEVKVNKFGGGGGASNPSGQGNSGGGQARGGGGAGSGGSAETDTSGGGDSGGGSIESGGEDGGGGGASPVMFWWFL